MTTNADMDGLYCNSSKVAGEKLFVENLVLKDNFETEYFEPEKQHVPENTSETFDFISTSSKEKPPNFSSCTNSEDELPEFISGFQTSEEDLQILKSRYSLISNEAGFEGEIDSLADIGITGIFISKTVMQ